MNSNELPTKASKVLIVDDEKDIRDILIDYLNENNYQFFEASNGKEAINIVNENEIDLIISDIKMPIMDGIKLSSEIQKMDEFIPFIFVTAFADADNILKALRAGAFEFITKPFQKEFIQNRVSKSLERRKYYQLQQRLIDIIHETLNLEEEAAGYEKLSFDERLSYLEELITLMSIKLDRKNR